MNPLMRYEPLVGRLDGLFNDFFRPALVWERQRRARVRSAWTCARRPRPTRSRRSCPA